MEKTMRKGCLKLPIYCLHGEHHILPEAFLLATSISEGHGNTAIEEGKYTLRGESGNVLDRGKYIVIWKQQVGQWKLHRDIWTTSLTPQGD